MGAILRLPYVFTYSREAKRLRNRMLKDEPSQDEDRCSHQALQIFVGAFKYFNFRPLELPPPSHLLNRNSVLAQLVALTLGLPLTPRLY